MRVIIERQQPKTTEPTPKSDPHFAVGRLDGYTASYLRVVGLPDDMMSAGMLFSRASGEFMSGANLNYLNYRVFNGKEVEEYMRTPEPAVAQDVPQMTGTANALPRQWR